MEKRIYLIQEDNTRLLIQKANELELTKEDIISVLPPLVKGDVYKMIYYK